MLPTLTVLMDDGTGTFPADISDRVLAADGYTISRGREDWQGTVTAGQLDITLNNSDGRFTPAGFGVLPFGMGGFGSTYVDQRIRVKETVNGVTYTRFTGYVKAWPVTWPATVPTVSMVRLTAMDAQARAERRPLRPVIEEEFLVDSPACFYTLGEPAGATSAGDTSGNTAPPLAITRPATGTDPAFGAATNETDGATGAVFTSNQPVGAFVPASPYLAAKVPFTTTGIHAEVGFMFPTLDVNTGIELLVFQGPPGNAFIIDLGGPPGSQLQVFLGGSGGIIIPAGVTITPGLPHIVSVEVDATSAHIFFDGVLVYTGAGVIGTWDLSGLPYGVGIGQRFQSAAGVTDTVVVSHVNIGTRLSDARVIAHHSAFRSGFNGETGTARLTRLAGYAGIPVGALDTSLTNVSGAIGLSGSFVGPEIQRTTDAELGLTYIDGTGALAFHNRNRVTAKTTPDLTLSSQWVTPDVTPTLDDQRITNYMEVTAEGTGATALVIDAASEAAHGRYSGSQSYLVRTDQEALDRGNWIVGNFAEATPRYGTLTINLFGMTPAQASTVLAALDLDCWLRVITMAPQNTTGAVADLIVQGWREDASGDTWTVTCNVVSQSLYSPVWILDDTTFSVLDSTTRLYV